MALETGNSSPQSRILSVAAMLVAAGFAFPPAYAADLGGNCCADLEERVAELEATTVRKGNRRVSLTISGQVHTQVMAWDSGDKFAKAYSKDSPGRVAGNSSDVYITDYTGGTGFNLTGDAKISPSLTAGFLINIGFNRGSRSHQVNQADDDANEKWPNPDATDGATVNDSSFVITRAAWYLDHKEIGRLTVGRANHATHGVTTIDLGGAGVIASADIGYWNGGFGAVGGSVSWNDLLGGSTVSGAGSVRGNVIHYTSPTVSGFQAQASWGENDVWDVALRYAGEFSGFRVATGIGYIENVGGTNEHIADIPANSAKDGRNQWKAGASILHVASGLYLTGSYLDQDNNLAYQPNTTLAYVQGGISKNWTGLGNTTLYGEYARVNDAVFKPFEADGGEDGSTRHANSEVWGLGVVQAIDAAAMELYLAYRHYSSDAKFNVVEAEDGYTKVPAQDFNVVMGGARIKF